MTSCDTNCAAWITLVWERERERERERNSVSDSVENGRASQPGDLHNLLLRALASEDAIAISKSILA